jgi:SHS2 domain-containing protein
VFPLPQATRLWVFSRFEARIEEGKLEGALWGEPFDRSRHGTGVEVKGPTFTELHVGKRDDGLWVAQLVVDV